MHIRSFVPATLAAALIGLAPAMAQTTGTATTDTQSGATTGMEGAGAAAGAGAGAAAETSVSAGASVYDTEGKAVGTVESVEGGQAIVTTGTAKVRIPVTAFAQADNGLVIAMTRQELEAAAGQAR